MVEFSYRAWGNVNWLIPKIPSGNWSVLGCVATEIRSGHSILNLAKFADNLSLVRIHDPMPTDVDQEKMYLDKAELLITSSVTTKIEIANEDLKASLDNIADYINRAAKKSPNLILDITSFPKRWFFPLLREAINNNDIESLVLVYTLGDGHAHTISENPEPLRHIPGFPTISGRREHDIAFLGVGYHLTDLPQLFRDDRPKALKMLFPFPPGPPGIKRNWKFIQSVQRVVATESEDQSEIEPIDHMHISALDISQTFDAITRVTSYGRKKSYMLPFGPKPVSAAMCLYAICVGRADLDEVPVFYSQPQRYNHEYTTGPRIEDGKISSYGYVIKSNGRLLYSI